MLLGIGPKEQAIIDAIHRNHKLMQESRLLTDFNVHFKQTKHPEKIYTWIERIGDLRVLSDHYLESIVHPVEPAGAPTVGGYVINIIKSLLPERLSKPIFDFSFFTASRSIYTAFTNGLFSLALGKSVFGLLFKNFSHAGSPEKTDQEQFAELINQESQFSTHIKQECERISVELIKLFHFREMLLLGKISHTILEPDLRAEFIKNITMDQESKKLIDSAVGFYFARELGAIFNAGFQSIYQLQDNAINSEQNSPLLKWLEKLFDSKEKRLVFTQEIQLTFMQLSTDFLLEQKNQPSFMAQHPILIALAAGLVLAALLATSVALALSTPLLWALAGAAVVGFAAASSATYLLITKVDAIAYKRSSINRVQIQDSINMINTEFLRLEKEVLERKDASRDVIHDTHEFAKINHNFVHSFDGTQVARGSIAGWLREYAVRYRHSKAVEIDLAYEYKELISQSGLQTRRIITAINNEQHDVLNDWIKGTRMYLKNPYNASVITDFELVQKIKEQILEIAGKAKYIPVPLLMFYTQSTAQGGLSGNRTDFDQIRRVMPKMNQTNPYHYLCDTALNLFKKFEPSHGGNLIFSGDPEYRRMLGIARGDSHLILSAGNIDAILERSYALLLSLCQPFKPGINLDPLYQDARVRDEFILYRMLLLKQLANLCAPENPQTNTEVKVKIKAFIQERFKLDPAVILDDLVNQHFLLNSQIQVASRFKNSDGFVVLDAELDNIIQALALDLSYNSQAFQFAEVLHHYIAEFMQRCGNSDDVFAHGVNEQDLTPQASSRFNRTIKNYCNNTALFLQENANNKAISGNGALECYKANVSVQVYKTQIRILKHLGEVSLLTTNIDQGKLLISAFNHLREFSQGNCFALIRNSECNGVLRFAEAQIKQDKPFTNWIGKLPNSQILLNLADEVINQLNYTNTTPLTRQSFFQSAEPDATRDEPFEFELSF